jgi:hypothetical protein
MQLTTRLPIRRAQRRTTTKRLPKPQVPTTIAATAETQDARRGGGPEDRALYSCMCGFAFTAAVSTSVDCPHCGTEQAW